MSRVMRMKGCNDDRRQISASRTFLAVYSEDGSQRTLGWAKGQQRWRSSSFSTVLSWHASSTPFLKVSSPLQTTGLHLDVLLHDVNWRDQQNCGYPAYSMSWHLGWKLKGALVAVEDANSAKTQTRALRQQRNQGTI